MVKMDQSKNEGRDGTAPELYDLFLASIGMCAEVYVVIFCQERGLDTSQIKMNNISLLTSSLYPAER